MTCMFYMVLMWGVIIFIFLVVYEQRDEHCCRRPDDTNCVACGIHRSVEELCWAKLIC